MNHHLLLVCFSLALTAHYCTTVELCISSCGNTCMDTLFMCACDSDCGRYRDCCGPSSLSPPSTCPPSLLASTPGPTEFVGPGSRCLILHGWSLGNAIAQKHHYDNAHKQLTVCCRSQELLLSVPSPWREPNI